MTENKLPRRDAYIKELEKRVLIFDGAMGTMLQLQKLTAADFGGERYSGCNDYLVLSSPQTVSRIHKAYLEAGADVVETDSFRANRLTLADYALADKTHEINFAAHASPETRRMNLAHLRNRVLLPAPLDLRASLSRPMIRKCPIFRMTSWWIFSVSRLAG